MALQSGLFFTTKGTSAKESQTQDIGDNSSLTITNKLIMNAMYLQIPVHFAYKIEINPSTKFVLSAGPYVAYGIGGDTYSKLSYSTSGPVDSETKTQIEESMKTLQAELDKEKLKTFDKNEGALKPFDFGAGISAGFEVNKFVGKIGWDMGLIKIGRDSDTSEKNMNAYLTVGYNF